MKNVRRMFVAILLASIQFLVFSAVPKVDYAEKTKDNTPENSVVIILLSQVYDAILVQVNPNFPHDKIVIPESTMFTPPLKPGSSYIRTIDEKQVKTIAAPCTQIYDLGFLNYEKAESIYGRKIRVPIKPGLYFAYYTVEGMKIAETHEIDSNTLKKIQKAAKVYAGTSWETCINKKLEEMSK